MWNPVSRIKKAVTLKLIRIGINTMAAEIDTPEEQQKIVTGIVRKGIPPFIAWALSLLIGVIAETLQTADISLLFTEPKTFGKIFLWMVLSKLLMKMPQPGAT